ncbi:helix-turn-helix domain-containing protein [Streptomyces echinatus]|uniref:helix-turn-helix domain-containing protein n=1 Tax=Streptomyces echinatus TaxID=67293 RepID=UPI003CD0BFAF
MHDGTLSGRNFGQRLRALRVNAGLSQEALSHEAGVSVRALADMERGRTRGPQRRTVRALAEALGLDAAGAGELEEAASLGRPRPCRSADADRLSAAEPAAAMTTRAPDLLPRAPRGFHGRASELAALARATAGEAPVCLVVGPAGVGEDRPGPALGPRRPRRTHRRAPLCRPARLQRHGRAGRRRGAARVLGGLGRAA